MKDTTYAVDIWWAIGNSMRAEAGLTYRMAQREAAKRRDNKAIVRVQVVKCVTVETVSHDWRRTP